MGYFRKVVPIRGFPVSCSVDIIADEAYNLFFNEHYIARVADQNEDWNKVNSHDLSDFLNKGSNILAIQVEDMNKSAQGLICKVTIRTLPNWDIVRDSLRPELANEKVQEQLILDRGKIP